MALLLENCYDKRGTNPTASKKQRRILSETADRVYPGQLCGRYVCAFCNGHKGPNLSGIDWATSRTRVVQLFNPRRHKWNHDFHKDGSYIVGKTRIGRVTVAVLVMNDPVMLAVRQELIQQGPL